MALSNRGLRGIGASTQSILLVFDHDLKPLLEVFLHAHSAAFEQVLNALDLRLQVLELGVLGLVRLLVPIDLCLDLVFLFCPDQLAVVVDHAPQSVLLSNLLDLIG